jgi:hypothetical protein
MVGGPEPVMANDRFAQENGNAKTAQKTIKNGKNGKKVSAAAPIT